MLVLMASMPHSLLLREQYEVQDCPVQESGRDICNGCFLKCPTRYRAFQRTQHRATPIT